MHDFNDFRSTSTCPPAQDPLAVSSCRNEHNHTQQRDTSSAPSDDCCVTFHMVCNANGISKGYKGRTSTELMLDDGVAYGGDNHSSADNVSVAGMETSSQIVRGLAWDSNNDHGPCGQSQNTHGTAGNGRKDCVPTLGTIVRCCMPNEPAVYVTDNAGRTDCGSVPLGDENGCDAYMP